MRKNEVGCLLFRSARGIHYFAGFKCFDYGESFIPYFSLNASQAFPLTDAQADHILGRLDFDVRKRLKFALYPRQDMAPNIFELEHSPIGGVI